MKADTFPLLFHTFPFFVFFVVVFTVYWALPRPRWRLYWLLAASCAFYMSLNPWLILLIGLSASLDYFFAQMLERTSSQRWRRIQLTLSIVGNLSFLVYFKYANFFLDSTGSLLQRFGYVFHERTLVVILPLGISFYTFEAISYVVDVYRGRIKAVGNPIDYALYILFFPHLVAGPIVRPDDFLPQLRRPKMWNWDRMQVGVQYFLMGMFKKAVLADYLAKVADQVFATPGRWASAAEWLGVFAYAVQVYCDFSGYSDMASGLARLLGYRLPDNFNMPYFARGPGDFWRRWHISLSTWLRDYVYIPLGGSRGGTWATYRNLLLTMTLGGFWHGARWNFVLWGFYHGVLLSLERALPKARWLGQPAGKVFHVIATFLAMCVGLVIFRAQSLMDSVTILARMIRPSAGMVMEREVTIAALACLALVLAGHLIGTFVDVKRVERRLSVSLLATGLVSVMLLALLLMPEDSTSFMYFQF